MGLRQKLYVKKISVPRAEISSEIVFSSQTKNDRILDVKRKKKSIITTKQLYCRAMIPVANHSSLIERVLIFIWGNIFTNSGLLHMTVVLCGMFGGAQNGGTRLETFFM